MISGERGLDYSWQVIFPYHLTQFFFYLSESGPKVFLRFDQTYPAPENTIFKVKNFKKIYTPDFFVM